MLGPTAAGKSQFALELAESLGAPLFSVDSMQVYREMDIGTAKASLQDQAHVEHHLIDLVGPEADFTLAQFQSVGTTLLDERGDRPVVIAGGSGLYFRSLVDPMSLAPADPELRRELEALPPAELVEELRMADPAAAGIVDVANPHRVIRAVEIHRLTGLTPTQRAATPERAAWEKFEALRPFAAVGIDPGHQLSKRIERRFDDMVERGLVAEIEKLEGRLSRTAAQAVGYKELLPVVAGDVGFEVGRAAALSATRALAKRQRTFFGKDPRIRWIEWHHERETRFARMRTALELAT